MTKTHVDDMLIEMIAPQVKAIEEKFSRGEGLTQADIHTLLLKSQYNHINHLDEKLDETVSSVKALEGKFNSLEGKFNSLKDEFDIKFKLLEEKIEHSIQKALNKNMIAMIAMLGTFATIFKLIDKFF